MRDAATAPSRWFVELDGFNVHAGVRIEAGDDEGRERLCRHGARPWFALGRLVEWPDGGIGYRVRWARSDAGPFGVDALACPKCGGRLEVLELVTNPDDAAAWLERLGVAAGRPEPRARAPTVRRGGSRAPPAGACVRSC